MGSVSAAISSTGSLLSKQDVTPWGEVRSGDIPQTTRAYTGQQRDGTGRLFYQARQYDPVLGLFISADTLVPGSPALTVWPSAGLASIAFSHDGDGPANPQTLNHSSYVTNDLVRYTGPNGA
jgi:RHS repeat-associated protein